MSQKNDEKLEAIMVPSSSETMEDVPLELVKGVNIMKHITDGLQHDATKSLVDQFVNWNEQTIENKDKCADMISGKPIDFKSEMGKDLETHARMAMLAYSMPLYWKHIGPNLKQPPYEFYKELTLYTQEEQVHAHDHMEYIMDNDMPHCIVLPNTTHVSGVQFRTPVRLYKLPAKSKAVSVTKKTKKTNRPPKDYRDLIKYDVRGAVTVTILRENHDDDTHSCYVLFRGTSNNYNGAPQYGKKLHNTQVFRFPQFDPKMNKRYPKGSKTVPLFYEHYCKIVRDVYSVIFKTLTFLQAWDPKCRSVSVTGHSQGGALTTTFCYLCKLRNPAEWRLMKFRTYASPMCCNDIAVKTMEQMIIDAKQPHKFIEVLNTDDIVLAQYLFGGKKGMAETIRSGSANLVPYIVSELRKIKSEDGDVVKAILRIAQTNPDVMIGIYINGAMKKQDQLVSNIPEAATRLGKRTNIWARWGDLKDVFKDRFSLVYCERNINWKTEYPGKAHMKYMDEQVTTFGIPLRIFENKLYAKQVKQGLKYANKPVVVGLCTKMDKDTFDQFICQFFKKQWWEK